MSLILFKQGSVTLILDPRKSKNKVTLELRDQEGISGNIFLSLKYYEYDTPELEGIMNDYEVFDPLNTVKLMLHRANTKSIGKALKIVGYKPKYPVIIVPGLASSALEVNVIDKLREENADLI